MSPGLKKFFVFKNILLFIEMADSGEWQHVKRGKKSRKGKVCVKEKAGDRVDIQQDKRRITDAMNNLRCEDFWAQWKEIMGSCLTEHVEESMAGNECSLDCVCYGLGNFLSCISARYQLAMLLLLLAELQIPVERCTMYDPVFTESEFQTLRELGFTVLTENEEGKRAVSQPTLFYLIHCGKALYNNLLWSNWKPQTLPKVIVVGNSFLGIQESMLQKDLERDYSFLSNVMNVCQETRLPCTQRYLDVFNDTALIRFQSNKLGELPESIWSEPSEPRYENCKYLEIIRKETRS